MAAGDPEEHQVVLVDEALALPDTGERLGGLRRHRD